MRRKKKGLASAWSDMFLVSGAILSVQQPSKRIYISSITVYLFFFSFYAEIVFLFPPLVPLLLDDFPSLASLILFFFLLSVSRETKWLVCLAVFSSFFMVWFILYSVRDVLEAVTLAPGISPVGAGWSDGRSFRSRWRDYVLFASLFSLSSPWGK